MSSTTTLAQRLVDALLARGAREIFGIPGDFALPLFREIERDGRLPILTLAHEPGSASRPTPRHACAAAWAWPR
jgi:indolepyruvate decarboxylase